MMITAMIDNESLLPLLMYNKPFKYNTDIVLYPVIMNDFMLFQTVSKSITLRKNSVFREKKIIKMSYLDLLFYSFDNEELETTYKISGLSQYLIYFIQLIKICCKNSQINISDSMDQLYIGSTLVTPAIFDDLRRIIIIQNGIDFDINEFLNSDTEQRLLKAEKDQNKSDDNANIEDYIDSLVIAMNITEERIMNMTIRKFWRYLKRHQLHEGYIIAKTGECSGMVSFKEPIKYWMVSLDEEDKYKHLKTDEETLKGKIG